MFLKKKKILITGGSGFIGKRLISFLKNKNVEVFAIENKNKVFIKKNNKISCSLIDKEEILEFIKLKNPDTLIHLGWYGIPDFSKRNNLINFKQQISFLKIIKKTNIKKIFISGSCLEYGDSQGRVTESKKNNNLNSFAIYKNKIRQFCKKLFVNKQLIWGRIFYAYGKGQRNVSLINSIIKKKYIYLKDPYKYCDFIHVDDVCSAIYALINSRLNGIFNISNNLPVLIIDFCKKIKFLYRDKKIIIKVNKFSKLNGNWGNNQKLISLGWKPRFQLMNGIKNTLNHK